LNQRLGTACLLGREEIRCAKPPKQAGIDLDRPLELSMPASQRRVEPIPTISMQRLQRKGYLHRDCQRLINTDRNHFGACMVALGDADAMVTGTTRNYSTALQDVRRCVDVKPGHRMIGVSLALCKGRTCPRRRHRRPSTCRIRGTGRYRRGSRRHGPRLGYEPRVAMLAYSTFGHPTGERSERVRDAVSILDKRRVDFEYDGEMAADVALNSKVMEQYPFCRLSGTANVLVMPAFHSASISTKMLQELGGSTVIGPLLVGLDKSIQIVSMGAKDSDIVNMAAIAAYNASN
jgi:malate dehydrogenase (oxaloacetate-decarboxylating)(NADP+)